MTKRRETGEAVQRFARINGQLKAAPRGTVAYKYQDPVDGARWTRNREDAEEIAKEDPSLIAWTFEREIPTYDASDLYAEVGIYGISNGTME